MWAWPVIGVLRGDVGIWKDFWNSGLCHKWLLVGIPCKKLFFLL